jgi:hypothetical protein
VFYEISAPRGKIVDDGEGVASTLLNNVATRQKGSTSLCSTMRQGDRNSQEAAQNNTKEARTFTHVGAEICSNSRPPRGHSSFYVVFDQCHPSTSVGALYSYQKSVDSNVGGVTSP